MAGSWRWDTGVCRREDRGVCEEVVHEEGGLRALPASRTSVWMAGAGSRAEGPPEGREQEGQRLPAALWLWACQEETEHRGDSFTEGGGQGGLHHLQTC